MHQLEQRKVVALCRGEQLANLPKIGDDQADGVERSLRERGVSSDTPSEDAGLAGRRRFDGQTVRIHAGRGQCGGIDTHDKHGLTGDSVGCLGTAPRADDAIRNRSAHKGTAEAALLGIADRE